MCVVVDSWLWRCLTVKNKESFELLWAVLFPEWFQPAVGFTHTVIRLYMLLWEIAQLCSPGRIVAHDLVLSTYSFESTCVFPSSGYEGVPEFFHDLLSHLTSVLKAQASETNNPCGKPCALLEKEAGSRFAEGEGVRRGAHQGLGCNSEVPANFQQHCVSAIATKTSSHWYESVLFLLGETRHVTWSNRLNLPDCEEKKTSEGNVLWWFCRLVYCNCVLGDVVLTYWWCFPCLTCGSLYPWVVFTGESLTEYMFVDVCVNVMNVTCSVWYVLFVCGCVGVG